MSNNSIEPSLFQSLPSNQASITDTASRISPHPRTYRYISSLHSTTYSLTSDYAQSRQGSSCEDKRNTRQAGAPFTQLAASKPRFSALELSFQLNTLATSQSSPLNQNRRGTKPQIVARAHLTSAELLRRSHKTMIGSRGNHTFFLVLLIRTYIACTCNLATMACVLCILWYRTVVCATVILG
jgi:hypothetical protein